MNSPVDTDNGELTHQVLSRPPQPKLQKPLLCVGARGSEVIELRKLLAHWGIEQSLLSQVFDLQVEEAVKTFQRRMFLREDGIVGVRTWQALYSGTPTPMPELQKGYFGQEVCLLQATLQAAGQPNVVVSGFFDPVTERAVRDFQRRKGLVVDGIVGWSTWRALSRIPR